MAISAKLRKKLENRKQELKERSGGVYEMIIIKEGTTRCRPLPVGPDEEFGVEVITFYHDRKTLISMASFNEPCALMDKYNELKESGDSDNQHLLETIKPRRKVLVPHIKYVDERGKEVDSQMGPKPLLLSTGLYQDLLDLFLDEEQGDFTDPIEGYDLKYKRTGKTKMDTEYSVVPCKPTRLSKEYNKIYDPVEMAKGIAMTYEQSLKILNAIMNVSTDEDDDDEDGEEKAVTRKSSKSKLPTKKKSSTKSSTKKGSSRRSSGDMD